MPLRRGEDRMTPRERMLRAFEFDSPDRIPLVYHPSPAGLHVHGEKLLDLFRAHPGDSPDVFSSIPAPPPGSIRPDGSYFESRVDAWGTTMEYSLFGIQGHAKKYPLADWTALASYTFPPPPSLNSENAGLERERNDALKATHLLFRGGLSLFERMCALRPMDDVLVDLYTRDERFFILLDRLVDYMTAFCDHQIAVGADVIMFGDDWGFQNGPVISPEIFRDVYRPRYEKLFARIKEAKRRVFFHSCGALGPIMDELIDMGVDGVWHQVNRYDENDFAEKCRKHKVTAYLHPDRQHLVPLGTPDEIRAQVKRYADIYHRMGGGGIFYIEIENDAPFQNVKALIEAVEALR